MSGQRGWVQSIAILAAANLDAEGDLYKVVSVAGTIAAENDGAIGILITKPKNGEMGTVDWLGKMKGYAGAAIAKSASIKVTTSGFLITVTSGDGTCIGKSLDAANSGDLFSLLGNFANANTTFAQQ